MTSKRIYLYVPRKLKGGLFRGGNEGVLSNMAVPINASYPVTRENAYVVPLWAQQAQVPIPVDHPTAKLLRQWDVPANLISVPEVPKTEKSRFDFMNKINFNSVASFIAKVVLDYLRGSSFQSEPLWKQALHLPAMVAKTGFDSGLFGSQPNVFEKRSFLQKAAPVVGTIANSFFPGTGTAVKLGLNGINYLKNKIFGKGHKAKKKGKKKSLFIFNNNTRKYLGSKVSFEKDVRKAADEAFKNRAQNARWRKVISSAFASAIKTIAPAIGSGKLVLGRKIKKSNLIKMGGTAADKAHMEWVRSFKKKKRKSKRRGGKFKYVEIKSGKNLFGGRIRRKKKSRRKHKRGGSKYKYYRTHALIYPKIERKKRKKKSGKGLVSSGILGVGDPRNPSGWFHY